LEENIFHLNEELDKERQIFSTKTEEIENIFHYEMSKKESELDELRRNLDIPVDDNKLKMLQQTIQNLTSEVRELKKKNEELEKQLLDIPKQLGDIPAKFHGSSNLNNNLYR
jgi:predicted RNase H-like nuclease (RuvC/YqgF family)